MVVRRSCLKGEPRSRLLTKKRVVLAGGSFCKFAFLCPDALYFLLTAIISSSYAMQTMDYTTFAGKYRLEEEIANGGCGPSFGPVRLQMDLTWNLL